MKYNFNMYKLNQWLLSSKVCVTQNISEHPPNFECVAKTTPEPKDVSKVNQQILTKKLYLC